MDLNQLGWQKYSKEAPEFEGDFLIGRVSVENKSNYRVITSDGEYEGILRGKTLSGFDGAEFPKVGDWVKVKKIADEGKVVLEEILPRVTKISRKSPGDESEQVIVSNIDVIFIVQSLPDDFNLRRLERYLVIAKQSGADPVVILSKIDLNSDYQKMVAEANAVVSNTALIIPVSAKTGQGMEELKRMIQPGITFVFLGSSGVGKSSLVNAIIGQELQATNDIREKDGKGRHTTTKREMLVLKDGGILIDTPGMRELALWADEEDLAKSFTDIEALTYSCQYSNCDHEKSSGCAIKAALDDGTLSEARYQSFLKLKKEQAHLDSKGDKQKEREKKIQEKKGHKKLKKISRDKY